MTIQEAIKSGKPFKPKGDKDFMLGSHAGITNTFTPSLSYADLISDDWIIKKEPISMEIKFKEILVDYENCEIKKMSWVIRNPSKEQYNFLDAINLKNVRLTAEFLD